MVSSQGKGYVKPHVKIFETLFAAVTVMYQYRTQNRLGNLDE